GWLVAVLALAGPITGCATAPPHYLLQVDSINRPDRIPGPTYVVLPGNTDVREADLHFQEYARYVKRVLARSGMQEAASFEAADTAIFLGYGIGEPVERLHVYSLPEWGMTGEFGPYRRGPIGSYRGGRGAPFRHPTYGVTGYTTRTEHTTTYFRYLFLDAYDLRAYRDSGQELQVWKLTVTSTGASGDLRHLLPVLVAASAEFIGTNTGRQIDVILRDTDAALQQVRGLSPADPPR
ncbi:MAG: hypothetical protein WC713_10335, partial [Candidatus Methylomirabilota bacterium]